MVLLDSVLQQSDADQPLACPEGMPAPCAGTCGNRFGHNDDIGAGSLGLLLRPAFPDAFNTACRMAWTAGTKVITVQSGIRQQAGSGLCLAAAVPCTQAPDNTHTCVATCCFASPQGVWADFPDFKHRDVLCVLHGNSITTCLRDGGLHTTPLIESVDAIVPCTQGLLLVVCAGVISMQAVLGSTDAVQHGPLNVVDASTHARAHTYTHTHTHTHTHT